MVYTLDGVDWLVPLSFIPLDPVFQSADSQCDEAQWGLLKATQYTWLSFWANYLFNKAK